MIIMQEWEIEAGIMKSPALVHLVAELQSQAWKEE